MKLVRYGEPGKELPGLIDDNGVLRDLSEVLPGDKNAPLSTVLIQALSSIKPHTLPAVPGKPRLGPCVPRPVNFIAVGLNYVDHAHETNSPIPTEPVLFNKAPNCISGPNDDIILPRGSSKVDWELELAIVIGRRARYVSEADAKSYIAGYCVCNDVSERSFQLEKGGQWAKGKSAESFGPLGPYLVTKDELPDTQKLFMWLDVNGVRMQSSTTTNMIFSVDYIVSYISQFMVLEVGDVITTGTPHGVGLGQNPPVFLKEGDMISLGIEGLGAQYQRVVAPC